MASMARSDHTLGLGPLIGLHRRAGTDQVLVTVATTSTGTESYTGCSGDGYTVVVNGITYEEGNPNGTEKNDQWDKGEKFVDVDGNAMWTAHLLKRIQPPKNRWEEKERKLENMKETQGI